MKEVFPSRLAAALSLLSCFLLASCTSLVDPYVDSSAMSASSKQVCVSPTTMADAKQCGSQLQTHYLEAMGSQARLSAATGAFLIPLTAYSSGLALRGRGSGRVTDFTLGTVALFGVSNWLSRPQRSEIYGVGLSSLQCAVDAMSPFDRPGLVLATEKSNIVAFDTARGTYSGAAAALSDSMAAHGDATNLAEAQAMLQRASAALTDGGELSEEAHALWSKFDRAPQILVDSLNGINTKVNAALATTVQSLASLPAVIDGLANVYRDLGTMNGLVPKGVTAAQSQPVTTRPLGVGEEDDTLTKAQRDTEAVAAAMAALTRAYDDYFAKSIAVSTFVKQYTPEAPPPSLASCGVDTSTILKPLGVSEASVEIKGTAVKTVTISGGSGNYVFTANSAVLSIQQTPAFGPLLTISVAAAAAAGNYAIVVQDSSGRTATIQVVYTK